MNDQYCLTCSGTGKIILYNSGLLKSEYYLCPNCFGSGSKDSGYLYQICANCKGSGDIILISADDKKNLSHQSCADCRGTGIITLERKTQYQICPICGGRGTFEHRSGIFSWNTPCTFCQGMGRFSKNGYVCPVCYGHKIRIQTCSKCRGSGKVYGSEDECPNCSGTGRGFEDCSYCGGTGNVTKAQFECPACNGTGFGHFTNSSFPCPVCNGTGRRFA